MTNNEVMAFYISTNDTFLNYYCPINNSINPDTVSKSVSDKS